MKEEDFNEKYKLPDGTYFTYKMYTDLMMYYDVMYDYKLSSIRELREKLDKLKELQL